MNTNEREDLENIVIGTMIVSEKHIPLIMESVTTDKIFRGYFEGREWSRRLYRYILSMYSKGKPIDLMTVTNEFINIEMASELPDNLQSLAVSKILNISNSGTWSVEKLLYSIDQLNNQHALDRLGSHLTAVQCRIQSKGRDDCFELITEAENGLFEITNESQRKKAKRYEEHISEATDELIRKSEGGKMIGLSTGLQKLDAVTGGLQGGGLIVIAGRPGMGKTALAMKIATESLKRGEGVYFVSREMTGRELVKRIVAINSNELSMMPLFTRAMNRRELDVWHREIREVEKYNLTIDEESRTLNEVILGAKRAVRNGASLVVVDYLQLLQTGKKQDIRLDTTDITRELKQLAKTLDVPVILLSQLSRAVESRGGNKIPQLSDLKESGSIEEDANIVLLLYRPEYYEMATFPDGEDSYMKCDIDVAKNRSGATGMIRVGYTGSHVRFHDLIEIPVFNENENLTSEDIF